VIPAASAANPKLAVLPLDGPLGQQAVDLLSEEFAANGINVVERAKIVPLIAVDTDLNPSSPAAVQNYSHLGETLGVRYLFAGTVSAASGPLYSYAHVNITLRLIDVKTGQTRWIGKYGNPLWSSAISTQGDLQRGAHDLVQEFIKAGGEKLLAE
jgi:TolB-like protein